MSRDHNWGTIYPKSNWINTTLAELIEIDLSRTPRWKKSRKYNCESAVFLPTDMTNPDLCQGLDDVNMGNLDFPVEFNKRSDPIFRSIDTLFSAVRASAGTKRLNFCVGYKFTNISQSLPFHSLSAPFPNGYSDYTSFVWLGKKRLISVIQDNLIHFEDSPNAAAIHFGDLIVPYTINQSVFSFPSPIYDKLEPGAGTGMLFLFKALNEINSEYLYDV